MKVSDWDYCYTTGKEPWNRSDPDGQLIKLIEDYKISPCTVLDVGCGRGVTARELVKRLFKVKGIDISSKAIEWAKFDSKGIDIEFEVVDFLKTKFLGSTYDLITDTGCFHYTLNRNFAKKVFDHLSPSGLWYTSVASKEDKTNPPVKGRVPIRPPAHSLDRIINVVKPYFVVQDIRHYRYSGTGFYFYSVLMNKRG